MFDVLHPVELLHPQRVDRLIHADRARGATTRRDGIPRRILLQLNILMVLHYVFHDLVFVVVAWAFGLRGALRHIRRPKWALGGVRHTFDLFCVGVLLRCCGGGCRSCGGGGARRGVRRTLRRLIFELLEQLHKKGLFLTLGTAHSRPIRELVSRHLVLLALHRDLRQVNRQCVVHLVVLEVVLDQQRNNLTVGVLVDLARDRVLPLETRRLLRVVVRIVLNRFEHLRSQLRPQRTKRALLLQILNHYVLQVVHNTIPLCL